MYALSYNIHDFFLRSLRKPSSSYSSGLVAVAASKEAESPRKVVATEDNVQSGFSVGGSCEVDGGRRPEQQSTLTEEGTQSQGNRDGSIEKSKGDTLLVNGFDKEPESLGSNPFVDSDPSSPLKGAAEEHSRKDSETAGEDLSPWKKPKPVSLALPPPPTFPPPPTTKIPSNPFDGLEDDPLQEKPVGVCGGSAQVSSVGNLMKNGVCHREGRSHDERPTGVAVATDVIGRNPFDDDVTGKNPFDDDHFQYGYEEPKSTVEIPGMSVRVYSKPKNYGIGEFHCLYK